MWCLWRECRVVLIVYVVIVFVLIKLSNDETRAVIVCMIVLVIVGLMLIYYCMVGVCMTMSDYRYYVVEVVGLL